jgi:hypothetical protein
MLDDVPVDDHFDYSYIAKRTNLYSPSDIRQLLQMAAMNGPLKLLPHHGFNVDSSYEQVNEASDTSSLKPLRTTDVVQAMAHSRPTPMSIAYRTALERFGQGSLSHTYPEMQTTEEYSRSQFAFDDDDKDDNFAAGFLESRQITSNLNRWNTQWGNFYNIGTLEIDRATWNLVCNLIVDRDNENDDDDDNDSSHKAEHQEHVSSDLDDMDDISIEGSDIPPTSYENDP